VQHETRVRLEPFQNLSYKFTGQDNEDGAKIGMGRKRKRRGNERRDK
jgi:hypothetical protein